MALEPQPLVSNAPNEHTLKVFPASGVVVYWSAQLVDGLVSDAHTVLLTKPFGHLEIGGVLTGIRRGAATTVLNRIPVSCVHEFGPAFELNDDERRGLSELIAGFDSNNDAEIVGWYRTTINRVSLSKADAALSNEFFPGIGQLFLVIQRDRKQHPTFGLFRNEENAGWRLIEELRVDNISEIHVAPAKVAGDNPVKSARPEEAVSVDVPPSAEEPPEEPTIATDEAPAVETGAPPETAAAVVEPASAEESLGEPISSTAEAPAVATSAPPENAVSASVPFIPSNGTTLIASPREKHLEYFGLQEDPFSLTPDMRYWYPSVTHREAVASLLHGIQTRKGVMTVTGSAGVGKTLVLEYVTEHLAGAHIEFAMIMNSRLTTDEFFEALSRDLLLSVESPRKVPVLIALQERVVAAGHKGSTLVILVEDAHRLRPDVLEEIELLSNYESRRGRMLQIILSGHPGLDGMLDSMNLRSLKQRISVRAKLRELDASETAAYINGRLRTAGAVDLDFFPISTARAVWDKTGGVPRLINSLAGAVMQTACALDRKAIGPDLVDRVANNVELPKPSEPAENWQLS